MSDDATRTFHGGSETSAKAGEKARKSAGTIRESIITYVASRGEGATSAEIRHALNLSHETGSARVSELQWTTALGSHLEPVMGHGGKPLTRPNAKGNQCTVYVAVPGPAPLKPSRRKPDAEPVLRRALAAIRHVEDWHEQHPGFGRGFRVVMSDLRNARVWIETYLEPSMDAPTSKCPHGEPMAGPPCETCESENESRCEGAEQAGVEAEAEREGRLFDV